MKAEDLWGALKEEELTFFSGVPCSLLSSILDACSHDPNVTYIAAPREDAALGVASGAYLAGRGAGILMQNSGLGNVVNGLTSFNLLYHVPVFMIISWRGYLGKDAPEHLIMGAKMMDFLQLMGIPTAVLDENDPGGVRRQVHDMATTMRRTTLPVAVIVTPGLATG